jgi:hypothetical protein
MHETGLLNPSKLPPLVAAGFRGTGQVFKMWGSDTFLCAAPCRTAERVLGLEFQKFHEPRHDFLSFAQPVFEAVHAFGRKLVVIFRK